MFGAVAMSKRKAFKREVGKDAVNALAVTVAAAAATAAQVDPMAAAEIGSSAACVVRCRISVTTNTPSSRARS